MNLKIIIKRLSAACVLLVCFFVSGLELSVAFAAEPVRPLVFIPGILGSELSNTDGIIWGDSQSLQRFAKLKVPIDLEQNKIFASGIIKQIQIFGPFKIHQYDDLFSTVSDLGYVQNKNFFIFPYDWRLSNFSTADKFARFVKNHSVLSAGKFDILAHSMGGLVARIYIQLLGGDKNVEKLITMGTPNFGSLDAFRTMREGWGALKNWLAGGLPLIKSVVYSFASLYELLPSYQNCCIFGLPTAPKYARTPFDMLDSGIWWKLGWIPGEFASYPRQDFVEASFERSRRLRNMINADWSSGVRHFKIIGNFADTFARAYFDSTTGLVIRWDSFPGDETVWSTSASANNWTDASPSFELHPKIFADDSVRTRLKFLLAPPGAIEAYAFSDSPISVITRSGEIVEIETFGISLKESIMAIKQPGMAIIRLTATTPEISQKLANVEVAAWLESEAGSRSSLSIRLIGQDAKDGSELSTTYQAEFTSPPKAGVHKVIVNIRGLGTYEDYVVTLPGG